MRRIVCVWLPRFRTDRLTRTGATAGLPPDAPLAVAASGRGGNRLVAVNAAADRAGLSAGMLLTDATAIVPDLRAVAQDLPAESAQLRRLALWCRRYTPWVAPEPPGGLRLDITGAAHLMGGEAALLRDLHQRFAHAGFACRAAAAGTPAAAWAMARHGRAALSIIPAGEERARLSPLPVRALRIEEEMAAALERLGLKTIGHLIAMPRAALRARFGTALSTCLDQAIGLDTEAQTSLAYEPVYRERLDFAEPVGTLEGVQVAAGMLAERLAPRLAADGKGARRFTLTLYDTRGASHDVGLTLARTSNVPAHILRLFRERLGALEGRFDRDVAFDAATMLASRVERIAPAQAELPSENAAPSHAGSLSTLIDRLNARLGEGAVRRFAFRESHLPERAAGTAPILRQAIATPPPASEAPRPFLLLPRPEEIGAIAEMPDYPPRSFTWRRVQHKVVKAEGPERIAPEWWQGGEPAVGRHYYAVEDEGGRRFWLFREGVHAADGGGFRWYLHGFLR